MVNDSVDLSRLGVITTTLPMRLPSAETAARRTSMSSPIVVSFKTLLTISSRIACSAARARAIAAWRAISARRAASICSRRLASARRRASARRSRFDAPRLAFLSASLSFLARRCSLRCSLAESLSRFLSARALALADFSRAFSARCVYLSTDSTGGRQFILLRRDVVGREAISEMNISGCDARCDGAPKVRVLVLDMNSSRYKVQCIARL